MTTYLSELYLDGGKTVVRLSERFWYSKSTDDEGVQEYLGRVTGWPTYSVRPGCVLWGDKSSVSFGVMEIANTDGKMSWLLNHRARDCLCIIRSVDDGEGLDNSEVVARCIIDKIEQQESTMRVILLGQDSRLDRPLQSEAFPDDTPNVQIRGTPRPVTIGPCLQIEPAQVDPIALEYRCADNGPIVNGGVYAGGSPYSVAQFSMTPRADGFTVGPPPAARLTATIRGVRSRYVDLLDGDGLFNADSAWDGSNPDNWTLGGTGSVTRIRHAGAQLQWPSSIVSLTYDNPNILPDTDAGWYMVTGRIAYREGSGAHLGVRFRDVGTVIQIHEEGEFCRYVYVDSGANRSLRIAGSGSGAGEVVVESLRLYKVDEVSGEPMVGMLWHLANRGGLTDDNFDDALLTRSDQDWIRDVGVCYHQRDATTARDALQFVLQSITGWAYIAPDGFLRIGTVDEPTGDPDLVASSLNVTSWPIYEPDDAPGLSSRYGYLRNWMPYTQQELAGITHNDQPPFMADYRRIATGSGVLARMYRHGIGADPVGTAITADVDAQSEADRITQMHESEWGFWMFDVAFNTAEEATALLPGAKIELADERFGTDFDHGQLIAVEGQYGNNTLRLIVRAKRNPS